MVGASLFCVDSQTTHCFKMRMDVHCKRTRLMPIGELIPNPRNPNTHSDDQLNRLAEVLKFQGWRSPIVVSTRSGFIVKGHGRLAAAKIAGFDQVPVDEQDYASEAMEWSDLIADNRLAELAEWDGSALKDMIEEMDTGEIDLEMTGFSEEELARLMSQFHVDDDVEHDGDGVDESPPENPTTKEGDIYEMNGHRLLCGDSTNPKDFAALMDGRKAVVAVSSPPYASQRKYDETSQFKPIDPDAYVDWFEPIQKNIADWLAEDGSWFLNIKEQCEDGQRHLYVKDLTIAHVRRWGWQFVDEYVWTHGGTPKAVMQRFKNGWEPIFQFTRGRHKFRPDAVRHVSGNIPDWDGLHPNMEHLQGTASLNFKSDGQVGDIGSPNDEWRQGHRVGGNCAKNQGIPQKGGALGDVGFENVSALGMAYPSNVLSLGKNKEALGHPAAYPTRLPEFFVKAYSDEGDAVLDPFMGSGATLVAAEQEGRDCFGMECSPAYCDIIVRRWARQMNAAGKQFTIKRNGRDISRQKWLLKEARA